jgi:hypothetical protein
MSLHPGHEIIEEGCRIIIPAVQITEYERPLEFTTELGEERRLAITGISTNEYELFIEIRLEFTEQALATQDPAGHQRGIKLYPGHRPLIFHNVIISNQHGSVKYRGVMPDSILRSTPSSIP